MLKFFYVKIANSGNCPVSAWWSSKFFAKSERKLFKMFYNVAYLLRPNLSMGDSTTVVGNILHVNLLYTRKAHGVIGAETIPRPCRGSKF